MAMVVPGLGELMMRSVALGIRRLPPPLVRRLWAGYLRRPRHYAGLLPDAHLRDVRILLREPGFRRAYLGTLRALARGRAPGEQILVDAELARLQVPTLLVWGEEDRLFPPVHAREAARRIAGARLEIFAGCGHTPQLEDAQRFNAVVGRFLAEGSLAACTDPAEAFGVKG
jgi:pimeloyl-ACP methyl ester carboxylesterase